MKANIVSKIFIDLEKNCNEYEDGVHMSIEGNGFINNFVICGDTEWGVDIDGCLLILEDNTGTSFIDTDSISRINI